MNKKRIYHKSNNLKEYLFIPLYLVGMIAFLFISYYPAIKIELGLLSKYGEETSGYIYGKCLSARGKRLYHGFMYNYYVDEGGRCIRYSGYLPEPLDNRRINVGDTIKVVYMRYYPQWSNPMSLNNWYDVNQRRDTLSIIDAIYSSYYVGYHAFFFGIAICVLMIARVRKLKHVSLGYYLIPLFQLMVSVFISFLILWFWPKMHQGYIGRHFLFPEGMSYSSIIAETVTLAIVYFILFRVLLNNRNKDAHGMPRPR